MRYFFRSAWLITLFCAALTSLAQTSNDQSLIDQTLERVNHFKINNQNDSALYELIALNQSLKAKGLESGYLYIDAGNIYFQLRLDNMAHRLYEKALRIFKDTNDAIGESLVLVNFGNLHSRANPQSDSVLYYFERALKIQEDAAETYYAAYTQRAIAQYYSTRGDFEKAHRLINKAIAAIKKPGIEEHPRYRWDVQFIPQQVYLTASDIFKNEKQNTDSAEFYLLQAIKMPRTYGIDAHRVRYLTFLGTFYLEQQQWPKAFDAIQHASALADSSGYVWGKVGALQALRNYYHQTKDLKMEAEAGYNYLLYKDRMYNARNDDDLIIMSNVILQYENELKIEQQQNLIREKEKVNQYQRQQNYLLMGILLLVIVGLIIGYFSYRTLKQKNILIEQYSSELQTSNETMRTMLSVISHDVRAPFKTLLGLCKITLMEKELSSSDYQSRVRMIHETTTKGMILLDNLLQWVALQRDKALIQREKINITELINETLHDLSSVALTENVTIEQQIKAEHMETDRNAVKAIVRNLLTNAIKYSGGKKVLITVEKAANTVTIKVCDQGPGIPEEILQGLFKAGDMKKVAAKGGGLGMQIVKELVTNLGGAITARNLIIGGAEFEVRIPYQLLAK